MITEEIAHINGRPKRLIVFLHGYQDYAEHIDRKTGALRDLPDTAFHIPQAPFFNEIDVHKRQWFSMHRFDPEDRRRLTPSWAEFVEYYNRMTLGLAELISTSVPISTTCLMNMVFLMKICFYAVFRKGQCVRCTQR